MAFVFKGAEGEIREGVAGAETVVALVKGVSVSVASGAEPVFEVGKRRPTEFKMGNEEVTGTIDKMHFDNRFIADTLADHPTEMSLVVKATSGANTFTATINNVIFPSWSLDMPAEDYVAESVEFRGRSISYA